MTLIPFLKAPELYEEWLRLNSSDDRTLIKRDLVLIAEVLDQGYTPVQVLLGMRRWVAAGRGQNLYTWRRGWEEGCCTQDADMAAIELVLDLELVMAEERPLVVYDYIDYSDGAWGAVSDDSSNIAKIRDDVRAWCDATLGRVNIAGGAGTAQRSYQDERKPSSTALLRAARRGLRDM